MWRPPQQDHDSPAVVIKEGEHAQQVTQLMLEVLKTCLMRRHAGYVRHLVELLSTVTWVVEPGGLSLLLCQLCKCTSHCTLSLPSLVPEEFCNKIDLILLLLALCRSGACAKLLYAAVSNGTCSSPYSQHMDERGVYFPYGSDRSDGGTPACVSALQSLPGVNALPQAAYMSLLRCSMADPGTAIEMLKMPQAQHVTAGDVGIFLATAMPSCSSTNSYGRACMMDAQLLDALLR